MSGTAFTSAASLARRIRSGDLSPVSVVETYLDRIAARNDVTNAYVTVLEDDAREQARTAQRMIGRGEDVGPLCGVPVALKDLFGFKAGVPATMGSVALSEYVPQEDSVVTERLEAAGAIVLGTTNTPEFGHKLVTDNELHGPTGTPFAPDCTSGGSSGGSAAAVGDGLAAVAQGSDAGGSIRIPASCCGVYGLKPSFGRVPSAHRPDAFSHSTPFISVGPIARTVEDAALVLDVCAGPHSSDPHSLPAAAGSYLDAVDRDTGGLSVAYSPTLGLFSIDERVRAVCEAAVSDFESVVGHVDRVDPPFDETIDDLRLAFTLTMSVKSAALIDGLESQGILDSEGRSQLGSSTSVLAQIGEDTSALEHERAERTRTAFYDAVESVLAEYDLLLSPTAAVPPFKHGQDGPSRIDGESVNPVTDWCLTWPFNLTGHPAASVPAGDVDGLPVGLQLVGHRHDDKTVLAASAALERVRPWQDRYPPEPP